MKQILVVFLAVFVCNASAQNFWRACHIAKPLPTAVASPQCTAAGCTVTRGGALTGTVNFTPTAAHQTIEMFFRVQPSPGGAWVDIPITTPGAGNACNVMNPGCPTTANEPQVLTLNVPIPPQTNPFTNANFEIWTAAILPVPADVFCFQVTATVN